MSRLAKGLVALCILLVVGATTGIQPASAGLLGPLGPKDAPANQPPTTQPAPPSSSATQPPKPASKPSTSKPAVSTPPKLARGPITPAGATDALLAALQPLAAQGMTMDQIVGLGFGRFPVGGPARFADTWMAPRTSPTFHWHKGTDIFAPAGTVVRAVADGVVERKHGGAGGNAIFLHAADGTDYYYAHLANFVALPAGNQVKTGDVIGTVGTTGNAEGDVPHTHFEVHPHRGTPVNPKPILDAWLRDAIAAAPAVVAAHVAPATAHTPVVMTKDEIAKALLRPLTPPALLDVLQLR